MNHSLYVCDKLCQLQFFGVMGIPECHVPFFGVYRVDQIILTSSATLHLKRSGSVSISRIALSFAGIQFTIYQVVCMGKTK